MKRGLNMTEEDIKNLQLHTDLMSSEDEGVSHPPSYRLPSCTDFLHEVDKIEIYGKPIDCVIGTVHRKPTPGHLLGNKNCII